MPLDVKDALVKVGATSGGSFATIADVRTYNWDHSNGTSTTSVRVFGRTDPYKTSSGDAADTYSISGLLALADTAGQNAIRTAFYAGTTVFLQVLHDGAIGEQQEVAVSRYSGTASADGQYVEFTADFVGEGAITQLVGG